MRLALIAHGLRAGGGISVGKNIIKTLGELAPDVRYFVSFPAGHGYESCIEGLRSREVIKYCGSGNLISRYCFEFNKLAKHIEMFKPDLILCLGNLLVQGVKFPQLLLVHNPYYVYPRKHHGSLPMPSRILLRIQIQFFKNDLKKAQAILCQTETMESRIRSRFSYQGKTYRMPNAVSKLIELSSPRPSPMKSDRWKSIKNKKKLLFLSAYYTHKNFECVLELFQKKRRTLQDYAVIFTFDRNQNKAARELDRIISGDDFHNSVVNVGPIAQENLASYYAESYALFMPSLMESFSATYLEAMHFKLPIITSELDFAREVCGDCAIYCDPWDIESIVSAIRGVDSRRVKMVAEGSNRLKKYHHGWDDLGSELLRVIEAESVGVQ